jgi:hypothetical protein
MAVTNQSKILVSDMRQLAAAANAACGVGRLSSVVSPLYQNNGVDWGYQHADYLALVPTARGTGYKPGDTIQGFGSNLLCTLQVEAVDTNGGIIGLKIVSLFPMPPNLSGISSPAYITSVFGGANTNGSGAQATYGMNVAGPSVSYNFPDYAINNGRITGVVALKPGTGYQAGDVIKLPFSAANGMAVVSQTITVNTVDSNGGILTLTPNYPFLASQFVPSNITSMSGTGGSGNGAVFAGLYLMSAPTSWASELSRLRTNLSTYLTAMGYDASKTAISGPWPISGPAWSNHDQWFWFEDKGGTTPSVTVSASMNVGSSFGRFTTQTLYCEKKIQHRGPGYSAAYWDGTAGQVAYATPPPDFDSKLPKNYPNGGPSPGGNNYDFGDNLLTSYPSGSGVGNDPLYANYSEYSIIIGGNQNVTLTGVFVIKLYVIPGATQYYKSSGGGGGTYGPFTQTFTNTPDAAASNPASLLTIGGNFPGTFSTSYTPGTVTNPGVITLKWTCNQTIAPGEYTATVTVNNQGNDSDTDVYYEGTRMDTDPSSNTYGLQIPDGDSATRTRTCVTNTRIYGIWQKPASGALGEMYGLTGNFPTVSITYTSSVADNGIDGNYNIKRINLPESAQDNGGTYPAGIYVVQVSAVDPPGTPGILATYSNLGRTATIDAYGNEYTSNNTYYYPSQAFTYTQANLDPSGFFGGTYANNNIISLISEFPQPFFNMRKVLAAGSWGVSTSVPGFWTGITQPIANINAVTVDLMPWNYVCYKNKTGGGIFQENPMLLGNLNPDNIAASNSYPQTTNVESQNEPPPWKAQTWFTVGFVIADSLGTSFFKCTAAGYSGANEPNWNKTKGATTNETHDPVPTGGTSTWAKWNCIAVAIRPALHRARPIPRYPFYWLSETIAALMPPANSSESTKTIWGCGNQWQRNNYGSGSHQAGFQQDNAAKGWWIYSVSINRITALPTPVVPGNGMVGAGNGNVGAGDTTTGAGGGSTANPASVAVTIGCIRSGSFVAFGTYNTGQTVQVLWPIFTSDALVYQCSERVDIQAVAIRNVSTGFGVNHPICAAFFNDTFNLLPLVQ